MTLTNPWPGRGWPANIREEKMFVARLQEHNNLTHTFADNPDSISRDSITLLVTALRHGANVDDVVRVAPNVDISGMLDAHNHLNKLLKRARQAWKDVGKSPTLVGKLSVLQEISKILPLTSERLAQVEVHKPTLMMVLANEKQLVEETLQMYDILWGQAVNSSEVRSRLYHPERECLLTANHFFPRCVSELSPTRLSLLLDEHDTVTGGVVSKPARTRQN